MKTFELHLLKIKHVLMKDDVPDWAVLNDLYGKVNLEHGNVSSKVAIK